MAGTRTSVKASKQPNGNLSLGEELLRPPLVIQHSRLAGFRHHAAPQVWSALSRGSSLNLQPERDNPHDPDAVAVYWRGAKLGYLPRSENLVAARLLARHRSLSARVRRLDPEAEHDRRLELDVLMH
jgi:hypothetical protein